MCKTLWSPLGQCNIPASLTAASGISQASTLISIVINLDIYECGTSTFVKSLLMRVGLKAENAALRSSYPQHARLPTAYEIPLCLTLNPRQDTNAIESTSESPLIVDITKRHENIHFLLDMLISLLSLTYVYVLQKYEGEERLHERNSSNSNTKSLTQGRKCHTEPSAALLNVTSVE